MLRIVEAGFDDGLGNITPEGCVAIAGVKYTFRVEPGDAGPDEAGMRSWRWELIWPVGPKDASNVIGCNDQVRCSRQDLTQVAAVCVQAARRQLGAEAARRQEWAEQYPRPDFQFVIDDAVTDAARAWKAAQVYTERAEWVASVEHFLWFTGWFDLRWPLE